MTQLTPGQTTNVATLLQGWLPSDPDAVALFAAWTTDPGNRVKQAYQDWIVELKDGGVWTLRDRIWAASFDAQSSRLGVKTAANSLTDVGTPTLVTGAGGYFQGSVGNNFDTGFNPATAGGAYTQNSAHLMIYTLDDVQVTGGLIGNTNARIQTVTGASTSTGRPINSGSTTTPLASPSFPGHLIVTRTGANLWESYLAGVDVGGGTGGSAAMSSETMYLCGARGAGANATTKIRIASIGGGVTALQAIAIHDADTAFLVALDAALA